MTEQKNPTNFSSLLENCIVMAAVDDDDSTQKGFQNVVLRQVNKQLRIDETSRKLHWSIGCSRTSISFT